jgi:hypothetical protein
MFNLGFGGQPMGFPAQPQMGPQMGFQGQFGGGFLQAPDASAAFGMVGGGVVYALNHPRQQPRDRSGRKPPYVIMSESDKLAFPVSTGQEGDWLESWLMPVSPVWYHNTTMRKSRHNK